MKSFIVFFTILVAASAAPSGLLYTHPVGIIASAPLLSQYHSQDSFGQYAYGYEGGPSAKNEVRSLDGSTSGNYHYVDGDGNLQSVAYTADALNGFRVAATNLPQAPKDTGVAPEPVTDTPEVVKARAEHLALVEQAGKIEEEVAVEAAPEAPAVEVKSAPAPAPEIEVKSAPAEPEPLVAPEPVMETEEVAKAREAHLEAHARASISGPEDVKLEPVTETPEVALARSEHLKSHEVVKAHNAVVEAIDNAPITVLAPHHIIAPSQHIIAAPAVRLAWSDQAIHAPLAIGSPYTYSNVVAPWAAW